MPRKPRRNLPPSQRNRPPEPRVKPGANISLPVIVIPPPVHREFTSHAEKIARGVGMAREQLAALLESGDDDHALRVLEQSSQPCGECQLCCELIAIYALNKPVYQTCPKQCSAGCSIHGSHPEECRSYQCFWKARWIDPGPDFRPDRLGAIFDFDASGGEPVLRVWQTKAGMALNHPEVRRITMEMAHQFQIPVLVNAPDNDRSIFLIPALEYWRPTFTRWFPDVPVYSLPGPAA